MKWCLAETFSKQGQTMQFNAYDLIWVLRKTEGKWRHGVSVNISNKSYS